MSKVTLQRKLCLVKWHKYSLARSSNVFDVKSCGKKNGVKSLSLWGLGFLDVKEDMEWQVGMQVGMAAKSLWYSVIKEHFSSVAWKAKEETERGWGQGHIFSRPSPANRFVVGTVSGNCTAVRVPRGGHVLRCALIRLSGTTSQEKAAARKRSYLCTDSDICLHAKPAAGFRFKWRGVLVQAGGLCTISVVPHTKILCWGEKTSSTSTLGNLEVSICSPKSVVTFFIVCLLLGRETDLFGTNTGHQTNLALPFLNQK